MIEHLRMQEKFLKNIIYDEAQIIKVVYNLIYKIEISFMYDISTWSLN